MNSDNVTPERNVLHCETRLGHNRELQMHSSYLGTVLGLVVLAAVASPAKADPVIGMFDAEANPRRADFLGYDRFRQDLLKNGMDEDLVKYPPVLRDMKQYNAVLYPLSNESALGPMDDPRTQAKIADEWQGLKSYVEQGGGLVVLVIAVRYPGDPIEKYYQEVFKGFGVKVLHEGVWDAANAFSPPGTLA
jgi:hypothetical protein